MYSMTCHIRLMSRPRSVLPSDLLRSLERVGAKIADRRRDIADDFEGVVQGLNEISTTKFVQAESEIFQAARLYHHHDRPSSSQFSFLWSRKPFRPTAVQLPNVTGLEYLFLLHRNGFLREAALKKIAGPIPSPFLFVAVAWRLNDWVESVRTAAADCAARTFPETSPSVAAEAAMVLLQRKDKWLRWGAERAMLDMSFARSDVAEELAGRFAKAATGPCATILRQALRGGAIDKHLHCLAQEAIQPAVRAVAANTLIDGFASWPSGRRWRWTDKSMGIRRMESVFEKRAVTVHTDRRLQIATALRDRSAAVRNAAIAALIRYRAEIPEVFSLAASVLNDPSRRVRERAEFLLQAD
jgi:hypothetical protein